MAKSQKGFLNSLRNIFGIASQTYKNSDVTIPVPGEKKPDRKEKSPLAIKLPDELQKLYTMYLADTYENSETLKNRLERYAALEYAYYNNSIISMTVELYADEVVQDDSQKEIIKVDAKDRKVRKYIVEFFEKIGLNSSILRNIAWGLALYGDDFIVAPSNREEGYTELVPIDVYDVKERFEFKASQMSKQNKKKKFSTFLQSDSRLVALSKILQSEDVEMTAQAFKSYLFGFDLGAKLYLPPWNLLHFRSFTTQSEFWPFGRPLLINSLAPFRQLQAAKNLMALARATSFPIRHYEVETGDEVDAVSQWEKVQEAIEEFNNLGNDPSGKEEFAANSSIWTPSGLISVDQIESRMNLDDIADIELLRDDLIMGTRVPKGYLVVDRSSFGTSGQSLLRQHKPFARAVYRLQSAILEELTQLVRNQFAMTGAFDYDEDFELSMNYPMVEESRDRTQTKNDTLRLAKDTIDNLGQALGLDRGEALPPDVVKKIFSKLSFLNSEDIDEWVGAVIKARESGGEEEEETSGSLWAQTKKNKTNKILESYNEEEFHDLITEALFQAKKSLKEGVLANNHFYCSSNMSRQQRELLQVISKDRVKALKG